MQRNNFDKVTFLNKSYTDPISEEELMIKS